MKMQNCKDVSKDFIMAFYEQEKEWIMEEGIEEERSYVEDMRVLLDDWIKEDAWDWRKQVKEYKGNEGLLMKKCSKLK